MIAKFRDDERGYSAWLDANPRGFVFNHFGGSVASDNVVHRANCSFLRRDVDAGARTTCEKVCGSTREEVEVAASRLRAVPDGPGTAAPNRPAGVGWSQREELGHLIDSAVNNHLWIVRAAIEGEYAGPSYDQDAWIAAHGYRESPWPGLVDAWHGHNRVLVRLVEGIPDERLSAPCRFDGAALVTLGLLIDDYVLHMRHHLDQIVRRSPVTTYPRA